MAKRKTTKKPVEPVIDYVDPETNLDMQIPEAEIDKAPESAMQVQHAEPLTVFDVLQRRMAREAK